MKDDRSMEEPLSDDCVEEQIPESERIAQEPEDKEDYGPSGPPEVKAK